MVNEAVSPYQSEYFYYDPESIAPIAPIQARASSCVVAVAKKCPAGNCTVPAEESSCHAN